jgi:hypothetical protein
MQEGSLLEYAEKTRCPDSRNPLRAATHASSEGWVGLQRAAFGRWTLGAFLGVWEGWKAWGRGRGGDGMRFRKCGCGVERAPE